jgi:RNA polymerase sigma factor (sigma-70 family)
MMPGKSIVPPFARTERELVRAAQQGNQRAIEYLITTYEPICKLIRSQMYKLDRSRTQHDELRAAANVALLEALHNFDATRGTKFTTYAFQYVRGAMLKALFAGTKPPSDNEHRPAVRLVSVDAPTTTDDSDDSEGYERELYSRDKQYGIDPGYDRVLTADRDAEIRAFVAGLGDGQRGIVVDLFWHHKTHAEIATERGSAVPRCHARSRAPTSAGARRSPGTRSRSQPNRP